MIYFTLLTLPTRDSEVTLSCFLENAGDLHPVMFLSKVVVLYEKDILMAFDNLFNFSTDFKTENAGLKYYADVLELDHLHYGYWPDPKSFRLPKTLTIDTAVGELRKAQVRYMKHLASYIPRGTRSVLDVGGGLGETSAYLQKRRWRPECLSPDAYQQRRIAERHPQLPFHLSKFEEFDGGGPYDLILFSESSQYINLEALVKNASALLKSGGYILISDYFLKKKDHTPNSDKCHLFTTFSTALKNGGFKQITSKDITANILPTLDLALSLYNKYFRIISDFILYWLTVKHRFLWKTIQFLFRKPVHRVLGHIDLIDKQKFREYKSYRILLYQKK